MNQAVLNFMKIGENSIVASNRIAKYIAQKTGATLIDQKKAVTGEVFDRVFLVNGPGLYCDYIREMEAICLHAKQLIWIGNDYAIKMPSFVKNHPNLWHFSAYENIYNSRQHHLVNWNQLTFDKSISAKVVQFKGMAYYGAYRQDREKYFKKYFHKNRPYPLHISSSTQGLAKFRQEFGRFTEWDGSNLLNKLGYFESTLYIEDEKSHRIYCSPANRFYEALSADCLILFDVSTVGTFERAGIDISPWVVDGPEEYAMKLAHSDELKNAQMASLRSRDYLFDLDAEFNLALTRLR